MLRKSNSHKLLLSLPSGEPNISEVTYFVLHVVYNMTLKEKTAGESRYNMLMKKKKQAKSRKKKYNTSMELSPNQSSLKIKLLRPSLYVTLFKSNLRLIRSFCSRVEISRKPLGTNLV